jgi:hypothetical protein
VERLIGALGEPAPGGDGELLRAVLRAYGGMAEAATLEWLARRRLTRPQVRALLIHGFLASVGEIRDAVGRAAT